MRSFFVRTKAKTRSTRAQKTALTFAAGALALLMQTGFATAQYGNAPTYGTPYGTPPSGQHSSHAVQFKHAFAHKFYEMLGHLKSSSCIGDSSGNRGAFLGIPAQNIHLSDFDRNNLNARALEEINRQYGKILPFYPVEPLQLAARLDQNNAKGRSSTELSIDALLKTSPFVLAMSVKRPHKDIVQIKIDLLARSRNGVTRCSKSAVLMVKLSGYTIIDASKIDSRENRNFVQSKYVYPYILKQFQTDIIHFKRLHLVTEFSMAGSCELRHKAASQFRTSYFAVRDNSAGRFASNSKDWPSLHLGKSARTLDPVSIKIKSHEGILYLRYERSGIDPDVVDVTMEIYSEGEGNLTNSSHLSMQLDPRNLKGCSQKGADPLVDIYNGANPKGLGIELASKMEAYKVGRDQVEFLLRARQPLYFFCLSIGADGTSRLAFPWKPSQLATPLAAGQTQNYPNDFGLSPFILQQEARELFGCYASPSRLPLAFENRWLAAHPLNAVKTGGDGVLSYYETRKLLDELNTMPAVGSAFTWLRAKK